MAKAAFRTDLHRIERQENLRREAQAKAKAEDNALEERMAETARLAEGRGEELERTAQKRGESRKPMRRLSGLEWLYSKKRLTDDQFAAGLRYGAAYRRAKADQSLRSILDRDVTGGAGPKLEDLIANAESVAHARLKLTMYRKMLFGQDGLVRACDAICGEEQTPREASVNGKTAEGLEAVLRVALDLLNQHLAPSRESEPQNVADAA